MKNNHSLYEDMSEPEIKVADFLQKNDLRWEYEQPLYLKDDKERPRIWTPDFFIKSLGIFIEVCGARRYKTYKYRKIIYNKNEIPIIFVETFKHNWEGYLIESLKELHQKRYQIIKNL